MGHLLGGMGVLGGRRNLWIAGIDTAEILGYPFLFELNWHFSIGVPSMHGFVPLAISVVPNGVVGVAGDIIVIIG